MYEFLRYWDIINLSDSGKIEFINSGSIASIISLILTIFIFFGIRKIKRFYIFTGRVPEVVKGLDEIASNISKHLNDYNDFLPQIRLELAKAEVALKTLRKKVGKREHKKPINSLIKTIKNYKPNPEGEEELRQIHIDLYKIVAEVQELRKDQKWER